MDLSDYKQRHPEREKQLERFENQSRIAELFLDLKSHGAMKMLLESLGKRIDGINAQLMENRELDDRARDKLFVERDCWETLGDTFNGYKRQLENIENKLKEL